MVTDQADAARQLTRRQQTLTPRFMPDRQYFVYIMTNRSRTLYAGVTGDLERRVHEHKDKLIPGFTSKYRVDRLVYFEATNDIRSAIEREKQIKGWRRTRKLALVRSVNPTWRDLSRDWDA